MNRMELHSWNQAWMAAEGLAWRNRHTHAVVYCRKNGPGISFEARLANDDCNDELEIATTVSRRPLPNGNDEGSCENLVEALAFVLLNLPHDTELAHLVRVEYSPAGKVWAHYFLSTKQEEIASWSVGTIEFFPGMKGSGRPIGSNPSDKIIRVQSILAEAKVLLAE